MKHSKRRSKISSGLWKKMEMMSTVWPHLWKKMVLIVMEENPLAKIVIKSLLIGLQILNIK